MHEASLMAGLMRKIDEAAAGQEARRVTAVAVWLGALSHMSAEHFTEHFRGAAAGGIAEGARLDITISADINHPHAQDVLLEALDVDT